MDEFNVGIEIDGDLDKVFDIITQGRFWPKWHVLSLAVAGTIERPYQEGDLIFEFIRTPNGLAEITWKVVKHNRPHKVTIENVQTKDQINYEFSKNGNKTIFKRVLEQKDPEKVGVSQDSEKESLNNLKTFVEWILRNEEKHLTL